MYKSRIVEWFGYEALAVDFIRREWCGRMDFVMKQLWQSSMYQSQVVE
jgi:hypothetical protein